VKKFVSATLGYVVITMILGMSWHFIFFKDLYHRLGIYNRAEPIIPLGLLSMLIQGLILSYLYPFFQVGARPIPRGIAFSLIMGLFLFSVTTLANAAKISVSSMSTWLLVQSAFHLIQFILAGILLGLVYGENETNSWGENG